MIKGTTFGNIRILFVRIVLLIILSMSIGTTLRAQNRFPRPEFQSAYTQPQTTFPAARLEFFSTIDTLILIAALALAVWLVLKKRSRRALLVLTIFSLLYFGFYRMGCICPIGSIQNVTLALTNKSFVLPITVGLFFAAPLIAALFFGRVFCSSICPLGAIQDVVSLYPRHIPPSITTILKLIPHLYLGLAILLVTTGSGFIICRLDPFIGIFRRSGPIELFLWGGAVLLIGIVVARPYCRFLCPYGVLLGWSSFLSKHHATITPDYCIQCRLCEDSCPYDAIDKPQGDTVPETRHRSVKRILIYSALLPLLLCAGAATGWLSSDILAKVNPHVRLAETILEEQTNDGQGYTLESQTFRRGNIPVPQLLAEAQGIRSQMRVGSILVGIYLALVVGLSLIRFSLQRKRTDYSPNRQHCLSCGRCFSICPRDQKRRSLSPSHPIAQEQ